MPKKNGKKVGRPSSFREEYTEQAVKLCKLGATDADLAEFFGVSETTINNWKEAHPEFLESLKTGKLEADMRVVESLYDKAVGAEWTEEQAFKVKRVEYEDGKRKLETQELQTVEVTRRAPPDTTAAIFWLKNRRPHDWRDKREVRFDRDRSDDGYDSDRLWRAVRRLKEIADLEKMLASGEVIEAEIVEEEEDE